MGLAQPEQPGLYEEDVVAYDPRARIVAALLKTFARGSVLAVLAALIWSNQPPSNPLKQIRLFTALFLAPELAAWCIARAYAAHARVENGLLTIVRAGERIEVPLASVSGVSPWRLPVPRRGGVWFRLRSGKRLERALAVKDPVSLVDAMVAGGAPDELRAGLEHTNVVYARARLASPPGFLENPVVKFMLFSLIPTVPVFRLHQYITYGGAFGEYYTFGLWSYLLGFALWWASWSLNLLYVASVLRLGVEVLAYATASLLPSAAVAARRSLEILQRLLFYVGIPTWIYLRLTA